MDSEQRIFCATYDTVATRKYMKRESIENEIDHKPAILEPQVGVASKHLTRGTVKDTRNGARSREQAGLKHHRKEI